MGVKNIYCQHGTVFTSPFKNNTQWKQVDWNIVDLFTKLLLHNVLGNVFFFLNSMEEKNKNQTKFMH